MSGEDRARQRKQTGRTDTTETIVISMKYVKIIVQINIWINLLKLMRILKQLTPHIRHYHGVHREKILKHDYDFKFNL